MNKMCFLRIYASSETGFIHQKQNAVFLWCISNCSLEPLSIIDAFTANPETDDLHAKTAATEQRAAEAVKRLAGETAARRSLEFKEVGNNALRKTFDESEEKRREAEEKAAMLSFESKQVNNKCDAL